MQCIEEHETPRSTFLPGISCSIWALLCNLQPLSQLAAPVSFNGTNQAVAERTEAPQAADPLVKVSKAVCTASQGSGIVDAPRKTFSVGGY